jgi:hypothetical protein
VVLRSVVNQEGGAEVLLEQQLLPAHGALARRALGRRAARREDLAFLASAQHVLQLEDGDRLAVIGIATTRYYAVVDVRAAIADARGVASRAHRADVTGWQARGTAAASAQQLRARNRDRTLGPPLWIPWPRPAALANAQW